MAGAQAVKATYRPLLAKRHNIATHVGAWHEVWNIVRHLGIEIGGVIVLQSTIEQRIHHDARILPSILGDWQSGDLANW